MPLSSLLAISYYQLNFGQHYAACETFVSDDTNWTADLFDEPIPPYWTCVAAGRLGTGPHRHSANLTRSVVTVGYNIVLNGYTCQACHIAALLFCSAQ